MQSATLRQNRKIPCRAHRCPRQHQPQGILDDGGDCRSPMGSESLDLAIEHVVQDERCAHKDTLADFCTIVLGTSLRPLTRKELGEGLMSVLHEALDHALEVGVVLVLAHLDRGFYSIDANFYANDGS